MSTKLRVANRLLQMVGLRMSKLEETASLSFEQYVVPARAKGMDVNDYLELVVGWEPAKEVIDAFVSPFRFRDCAIAEIGPGTGRHARFMLPGSSGDRLHLFDSSQWVRNFLKHYFPEDSRIIVHPFSQDYRLELPDSHVDIVFSNGTFIALKLGEIREYALESCRILKQGGHFIFDYLDITREAGWHYLHSQSCELANCYTYHTYDTILRVCRDAGFALHRSDPFGKSVYVNFVKI